MQISKSGLFVLLALFFASYSSLSAQCYGNPQGNSSVCSYSPITYTVNSTCGNCTHTWSSAGLVSGQGTATATFLFGSDGVTHDIEYPQAQSYDRNFGCSYYDTWELIVGRRPNYPMPTLLNGPWDGDTSKVWIYHRNRGGIHHLLVDI